MDTPTPSPQSPDPDSLPTEHAPLPMDFEAQLLRGLTQELLRRVSDPQLSGSMTAAEMQLIRQLCQDNSISFASIKRGDFGETARRVSEEFPFDETGNVVTLAGRA